MYITGDYDTVKVSEKRGTLEDLYVVGGSSVPFGSLPRREAGNAGKIAHKDTLGVHLKARTFLTNVDSVGVRFKRDQSDGVAGRVDIMVGDLVRISIGMTTNSLTYRVPSQTLQSAKELLRWFSLPRLPTGPTRPELLSY